MHTTTHSHSYTCASVHTCMYPSKPHPPPPPPPWCPPKPTNQIILHQHRPPPQPIPSHPHIPLRSLTHPHRRIYPAVYTLNHMHAGGHTWKMLTASCRSGQSWTRSAPRLANQPAACSQMLTTSASTGAMPRLGLHATLEGRGSLPGCIAWQKGISGGLLLSRSLQHILDQHKHFVTCSTACERHYSPWVGIMLITN